MTAVPDDRDAQLARSWEANADAWTTVVRDGRIPSRRAGTDEAIVAAVSRAAPAAGAAILDVGCGEGWLARALAARGARVLGVDGSAALVERARAAGGGGVYEVATYDDLVRDPAVAPGPFDAAVLNYALLAERVAPLLRAVAGRLAAPGGALVIQTVHPWVAAGERGYRDEWRDETFAGFGADFPARMPWFFRTLGSWVSELRAAGLAIDRLEEPPNPETGQPLSLVLTCRAAGA